MSFASKTSIYICAVCLLSPVSYAFQSGVVTSYYGSRIRIPTIRTWTTKHDYRTSINKSINDDTCACSTTISRKFNPRQQFIPTTLSVIRRDSSAESDCTPLRQDSGKGVIHSKRGENTIGDLIINDKNKSLNRRDVFQASGSAALAFLGTLLGKNNPADAAIETMDAQSYFQRFPTLFAPLYGSASRPTIKRQLSPTTWALEQNLELGPLQVPLRCVVVRLSNGKLWVHAPLAPTEEFFQLVESCANNDNAAGRDASESDGRSGGWGNVAHIVVPTYALEHKIFVKDALQRWKNAQLWTAPGQFNFPIRNVPNDFVWGRPNGVSGEFLRSDEDESYTTTESDGQERIKSGLRPSWTDEIQYETLTIGTFPLAGKPTTFYETAFYHVASKTLIVTDALAKISIDPPPLNSPDNLLLISKRSTDDELPGDTPQARQVGWEKTTLLVSYFFPEHEELDPERGSKGVVTWTDGWHDNFQALSNRLLVPPVVRTLLYRQNPEGVRRWVDRVVKRWGGDMECIVPAHFEAPIRASGSDVEAAFRFLDDFDGVDPFPAKDLKRGLKPIADLVYKQVQ